MRRIAMQHGVSENAIRRHRKDHLPDLLIQAKVEDDLRHAIDVVQQLGELNTITWSLLYDALKAKKVWPALHATDRIMRQLELAAELQGNIDRRAQVLLINHPDWAIIRSAILEVLASYPQARVAVAEKLLALDAINAEETE